jgi:hypothetical protein
MDKSVSLVLSQERWDYRKVAQENWGLTNEQMKGTHVHHHPPKSEGGRNIPEHLYVCSPSMHAYGWHSEENNRNSQIGKNKGKTYWHNPETLEERFAVSSPGPEWVKGMSKTHKDNCHRPKEKMPVVCVLPSGEEIE